MLTELIDKLNNDLANEYKHMLFYLQSAIIVQGLHRAELSNFLLEHAKGEMAHVEEFGKAILDLAGKINITSLHPIPYLTSPIEILEYALEMENEVVTNYVNRIKDAQNLGGVDGSFLEIFLEDQILDSRKDAAEIKEMLRNAN